MSDPLADAAAWYDRAQKHIAEYRALADSERPWKIHTARGADGTYIYSLRFNRDFLSRLKPIACEAANALFQALDNIIGAAARRAGVERTPQIAWPWKLEPDPDSALPGAMRPAIGKKLGEMRRAGLPKPWLELIEETLGIPAAGLPHIDVLKEVSLSGKHWELVPTNADVRAISWLPRAAKHPVFADVPEGHFQTNDEYIFHQGEPIRPLFQLIAGNRLVAAGKALEPEPIAAFGYGSRFVTAALEGARHLVDAEEDEQAR